MSDNSDMLLELLTQKKTTQKFEDGLKLTLKLFIPHSQPQFCWHNNRSNLHSHFKIL